MKRLGLILGAIAGLSMLAMAGESDPEVAARRVALDLAGAFSNDGFKLRDGHWCGTFEARKPQIIQVNLYAGNQYWFAAAANAKAKKIAVDLYDEGGKPLTTENYNEGERASAGFSPTMSGQYFVAISLVEGEPSTICLVYSYK